MVNYHPEEKVARPVALQRWDSLTFVHWSYHPEQVRHLVPDGLSLDLFRGLAWVGLTPFAMTGVRLPGTPAVPGLSTFPEVNVRTYVRDRTGSDGLLFLTLECARAGSMAARLLMGLPYTWAAMSIRRGGNTVRYVSRRRLPVDPRADLDLTVRIDDEIPGADRTPFDDWLTGRWRAFSRRGRQLFSTPVQHQPWPLHRAEITAISGGLLAATGVPQPGPEEPFVHYSPGVDVRLGPPRLVD